MHLLGSKPLKQAGKLVRGVSRSAREAEVRVPRRVTAVLGREGRVDSGSLQAAGSGAGTGGTVTKRWPAGSSPAVCR